MASEAHVPPDRAYHKRSACPEQSVGVVERSVGDGAKHSGARCSGAERVEQSVEHLPLAVRAPLSIAHRLPSTVHRQGDCFAAGGGPQ